MSRELPEFPNLEHLKKQAKVRLHELQQRDTNAKLSDAQLRIAREYGFASWMKLKKHVESLQQASSGSGGGGSNTVIAAVADEPYPRLFERFTEPARRLIFFARYFASRRGSDQIEVHHLLLGLLKEDEDRIRRVLNNPLAADRIRHGIETHEPEGTSTEPRPHPLSQACREMLQRAAGEADSLGHSRISTGHFWLAFLHQEALPAIVVLIEVLRQNGISLERARQEIIASLS